MEKNNNRKDSREYLANERTFLAWIRTGIAIIAFGFVVVKFSLFFKQFLLLTNNTELSHTKGYSSYIGIIILVLGVSIFPFAYYRYKQVILQLDKNQFTNSKQMPIVLTIILTLITLALIAYLLTTIN